MTPAVQLMLGMTPRFSASWRAATSMVFATIDLGHASGMVPGCTAAKLLVRTSYTCMLRESRSASRRRRASTSLAIFVMSCTPMTSLGDPYCTAEVGGSVGADSAAVWIAAQVEAGKICRNAVSAAATTTEMTAV